MAARRRGLSPQAMPTVDILIVEDEPDIRDALRLALELDGFSVSTAANGREGLEALARGERPALVLLDLLMPVMNGAELLARLRADPALADQPVVLVSAFGAPARETLAMVQGTLGKPVELDDLLDVAARFCRCERRRGDAEVAPAGN